MRRNRLEAFSDGVLAIIITIMVLELKVPHGADLEALRPLLPVFLSYVLSFVYLAIYWNNHHHLLHTVEHVSAGVLWSNLHLLFWLSLLPFVTGWLGENNFEPVPTAVYGGVLLLAGVAYWILEQAIIRSKQTGTTLQKAVGKHDRKGLISVGLYVLAIVTTLFEHRIALAIYLFAAIMWVVPDRRIEEAVEKDNGK